MTVVEREATSMAGLTWRNHGSGDPPCQAHEYPGGGHLGDTQFEHSSIIITHHHPPYPGCEWAFKFAFPAWPPSFSTARRGEKLWVRVDSNGNPSTDEGPPHLATIEGRVAETYFSLSKTRSLETGRGRRWKAGRDPAGRKRGNPELFSRNLIFLEKNENILSKSSYFCQSYFCQSLIFVKSMLTLEIFFLQKATFKGRL